MLFAFFKPYTETPIIHSLKNKLLFISQLQQAFSLNHCTNLWAYMAPANPKSEYLPAFHLSFRSTIQRCTSKQCSATYSKMCASRAQKSVLASTSYLKASRQISWLRPRQSRTESEMVPPNYLMSWMILSRSATEPLAAFSSISPIKTTSLWEVGSSKQYLTMYGPGRLFSANTPSNTY